MGEDEEELARESVAIDAGRICTCPWNRSWERRRLEKEG